MNLRALLLAVFLMVPAAAQAAPAPWVGFNDISGYSGRVTFDKAAQSASNTGATSSRMIVDWSWIENDNDNYSWGMVDGAYWANLARGIRPLIGVTGAPRWAWASTATCAAGTHCAYPPAPEHYADYKEMLQRLTARYPQAVAIEIGNEPNLSWAWGGAPDPVVYTALLKTGYTAIKAVNPAMTVIAGGLAPVLTDTMGTDDAGLRPFLQGMYDAGAKGYMDGISIHPYPYNINFSTSFAAIRLAKEVRSANGDDVPLWATEFGMSTTNFSTYDQGTAIPALYKALRRDPEIRGVYVHTLYDDPQNAVISERGYGLMVNDLTPKPAYCAIAVANASRWRCPKQVAKATPTTQQQHRWDAQVLLSAAADAARRIHVATGSYAAVNAATLRAQDSRISLVPGVGTSTPGPQADPSRIGAFLINSEAVALCNNSRADRSYCIVMVWQGNWRYGSTATSMNDTASATIWGQSSSW